MSAPVATPHLPPSRRPLPAALADAVNLTGATWRKLAAGTAAADPEGRGFSFSYLNGVANAEQRPPVGEEAVARFCELVAAALSTPDRPVAPTYFREYRELLAAREARRLADSIGLDEVLKALSALERRHR